MAQRMEGITDQFLQGRRWGKGRPRAAEDRQHRPQVRPKTAKIRVGQNHPHRPQDRPKTAHRGLKSDPRPPTEARRAAQDRPQRPRERPKTAHRGPESGPDRPQRPRERAKTTYRSPLTSHPTFNRKRRRKNTKKKHAARQLHDRPSIENIEKQMHRQNMLPVNIEDDNQTTVSLSRC